MRQLDNGMVSVYTLLSDISREVSQHTVQLRQVDGRLDLMDAPFDGMDARFDGVDARFDGIAGTVQEILRRLPDTG